MLAEIQRRRTFAIISHPDAGKTTLTEKLLLYGGAVQLADGSLKTDEYLRVADDVFAAGGAGVTVVANSTTSGSAGVAGAVARVAIGGGVDAFAMELICVTSAVMREFTSVLSELSWPLAFFQAAKGNEATIHPRLLGLSGLLSRLGAPRWALAIAVIAGAVIVYHRAQASEWLPSIAFAVAAGVAFAPRALVYDASLLLPWLLLQFPPTVVVAFGAALLTVVTPAAIVSEVTTLAVLWIPKLLRDSVPRS